MRTIDHRLYLRRSETWILSVGRWRDRFVYCGNEVGWGTEPENIQYSLPSTRIEGNNINVNYYVYSLQIISAFNLDQSCLASFLTCLPGLILICVSVTQASCPTCPCLWHSATPQWNSLLWKKAVAFFLKSFWLCHLGSGATRTILKGSRSGGWGALCLRQWSRKLGAPRVWMCLGSGSNALNTNLQQEMLVGQLRDGN